MTRFCHIVFWNTRHTSHVLTNYNVFLTKMFMFCRAVEFARGEEYEILRVANKNAPRVRGVGGVKSAHVNKEQGLSRSYATLLCGAACRE